MAYMNDDAGSSLTMDVEYLAGEVEYFDDLLGSLWCVRDYVRNSNDEDAVRLPVVQALTRHMGEVETFVGEMKAKIAAV